MSVTSCRLSVVGGFLLGWLLLLSPALEAQLSPERDVALGLDLFAIADLGGAAGAMSGLKSEGAGSLRSLGSRILLEVDQPVFPLLNRPYPAPATAPVPFDFTRTAPHLAFFCRLEINEKAGGIIPAKFRLGGHRYWQDNLLRQ